MKIVRAVLVLLAAVLVFGCRNDATQTADQPQGIVGAITDESLNKCGEMPKFYSLSETSDFSEGFLNLIKIDTRTGNATTIWKLGVSNTQTEVVTPFGLAFDVDGTMYTIITWLDFVPGHQKSRLARVDMRTGAVTYIGPYIPQHFAGPDIDSHGNLYATSFTVGDPAGGPPLIFGDSCLYRFNKRTGEAIRIGKTGRGDWMDLAFDSHDRLWATTENKLYILNTRTGAATFVMDITGVPHVNIPGVPPEDWPYMMVMTIAFDENDGLWATSMRGFSNSFGNGTVMKIDMRTGRATVVGYTGKPYNHGGDIIPSHVNIRHRRDNGHFDDMTISMDALQSHLAHGDYVPGAGGE